MSARQWLRSLSGAALLVAFPAMLVVLLGVLVGAEVLLVTESVGKALSWALFVDLPLMDDRRPRLSRDQLGEPIGADLITEKPDIHQDRIGLLVFGLAKQSGRERYAGLLQLLHTLRAPDMGNRIDEGNLPKILSDALPPLSETALRDAGERLDALKDSREEQRRLMVAVEQVDGLLDVYRRYVAKALYDTAEQSREAAAKSVRLAEECAAAVAKHGALLAQHAKTHEDLAAARERHEVLGATIEGIKESDLYRAGLDMENLARNVSSLGRGADTALKAAGARRAEEVRTVGRTDGQADAVVAATERAASVLAEAKTALRQARLPTGTFPADITVAVVPGEQLEELVRQSLDEPPVRVIRPAPRRVTLSPDDLAGVASTVQDVSGVAGRRSGAARNRLLGEVLLVDPAFALGELAELGRRPVGRPCTTTW